MYIQGTEINKRFKGSFEHKSLVINKAIEEHFKDNPVNILATHSDKSYAIDSYGNVMKITYKMEGENVYDIKSQNTDEIKVIHDEDINRFVSDQLKALSESAMRGDEMPRTQVRELVQLINKDEDYWLTDILDKINKLNEDSEWSNMYEANKEQVRTKMWGNIRNIESNFPNTKFSKINKSKINAFEEEIKESFNLITNLSSNVVDECNNMVFDEEQEEFFGAVCESLKVEAQALSGLISKAVKLMRKEEIWRMAEAHDVIIERVKEMAVVAEYMKRKSQHKEN